MRPNLDHALPLCIFKGNVYPFQVVPLFNTIFMQVFADHNSSLNPIDVPRDWIWNLRRRTVYFGTSIPTIFKGKDYKRDGF